jgi:hypothetical protein
LDSLPMMNEATLLLDWARLKNVWLWRRNRLLFLGQL